MLCKSATQKSDSGMLSGAQTKSITIPSVSADDSILIETSRSAYRFRVANPAERRGLLAGGAVGPQAREAILVAALGGEGNEPDDCSLDLRLNARAVFIIVTPDGPKRMVTSPITSLCRAARSGEQEFIA
jgi:hypothetical protein